MPPTSSRARFSSRPRLGLPLRPDSRHGSQPALGGRRAKLVGRADAERPAELDRALRAETEIAAEADQVRGQFPFQLRQLGDLARLDQLAQARLDPRADSTQLADTP
jgi:hypothetical protein